MKVNELYFVKEYNFDNPFVIEIESIIDKSFKNCHNNFFHKFKYDGINDNKFTSITDNEIFNLTISVKSMNLYELKRKLKVARHNGFTFIEINKLTKKFYSHLR